MFYLLGTNAMMKRGKNRISKISITIIVVLWAIEILVVLLYVVRVVGCRRERWSIMSIGIRLRCWVTGSW